MCFFAPRLTESTECEARVACCVTVWHTDSHLSLRPSATVAAGLRPAPGNHRPDTRCQQCDVNVELSQHSTRCTTGKH